MKGRENVEISRSKIFRQFKLKNKNNKITKGDECYEEVKENKIKEKGAVILSKSKHSI